MNDSAEEMMDDDDKSIIREKINRYLLCRLGCRCRRRSWGCWRSRRLQI